MLRLNYCPNVKLAANLATKLLSKVPNEKSRSIEFTATSGFVLNFAIRATPSFALSTFFSFALGLVLFLSPVNALAGKIEYKPLPTANEASIELMAGQMIMLGFRGDNAEANPILNQIKNLQLGGVILFDRDLNPLIGTRNVTSKQQLKKLVASLRQSIAHFRL